VFCSKLLFAQTAPSKEGRTAGLMQGVGSAARDDGSRDMNHQVGRHSRSIRKQKKKYNALTF
jgi:hypothetical protein